MNIDSPTCLACSLCSSKLPTLESIKYLHCFARGENLLVSSKLKICSCPCHSAYCRIKMVKREGHVRINQGDWWSIHCLCNTNTCGYRDGPLQIERLRRAVAWKVLESTCQLCSFLSQVVHFDQGHDGFSQSY